MSPKLVKVEPKRIEDLPEELSPEMKERIALDREYAKKKKEHK